MKTFLVKLLTFFRKKDTSWCSIEENLLDIKEYLHHLLVEDQSQNLEFFQKFSSTWKEIIEKKNILKHPSLKLKYLQQLIESIDEYPPKKEFSLNYYLLEETRENILPTPLSEMLQTLHLDRLKLQSWIELIEKILT